MRKSRYTEEQIIGFIKQVKSRLGKLNSSRLVAISNVLAASLFEAYS
jgi:hypothetical protein